MNPQKHFSWIIIIAAFLLFSLFSSLPTFITDWWWFSGVGYAEVFIKTLGAKIGAGLGAMILAFLFLFVNLFIANRSKASWLVTLPAGSSGRPISLDKHAVKNISLLASLLIAVMAGLAASRSWLDFLKFASATPFGIKDPVFGKDVAFYVFSLPVISFALGFIKILIILSLIGCGAIYILRGELNLLGLLEKISRPYTGNPNIPIITELKFKGASHKPRVHLGILLFFLFAALAAGTYFSLFKLLVTQSGPVFGAAHTDVTVMVPLYRISIFVTSLAAILALVWGVTGKSFPLIGAVALYAVIAFATGLIPSVYQKLVVAPNEFVKETPFIKNNIAATKTAFGLDTVEEREISGDKPLTAADITNNSLTVKNVRIWDRDQLLSTFSQIQEMRTYYEFASVDNDRYIVDGEMRQIMLSLREIAADSLPNRSWINERLTFTHGYGLAAGPVNQATAEGLPVLYVKDLPPKSEVKELAVERPEIYFGELSSDYVIAGTKTREFNYPKGEENVYASYEGSGGVEISSFFRKILFALRFADLKFLLSSEITQDSRIIFYRNIKDRIGRIAPFLTYDRDPYAVVADGRIFWIADAYTTTNLYPYSQPLPLSKGKINYIRNSVKVVVDAYDGTVTFYQADDADPIMRTYTKIFPKTFRPLSELPQSLQAHLRYPEDIFTLQTVVYATYHMDDPQMFYNKEDQWEIPSVASEGDAGGNVPVMAPRHMIMKLPGEKKSEYILMIPFTPRAKDNLSAWMVARNDQEFYGKLVVYRFPKQKLVFGPKQIIARINQDAEISRQITLWDQRGSQVIQGPLLVIPVEESLLYVRPLYLKADAGKIPELKRVIVAYENKIAMGETIEQGLATIFGAGAAKREPEGTRIEAGVAPALDIQGMIKQAGEVYEAAIRAQREGNWARYGEEVKRLGEILNKMRK